MICENRKAAFNYQLLERFEAGMVLKGSEVKSIRSGKVNLGDAYGMVRGGEIFLINCHIASYQVGHFDDHEPLRTRKLLLHAHEISKLIGKIHEKGLTLIPTKMYFKKGLTKVEVALAKSKKLVDKRQAIKKRETDRDLRRMMRRTVK